MLDELKNLEYQGGKDGLIFLICNVIGEKKISKKDAEVICSHSIGKRYWPIDDLVTYCTSFGWIQVIEGKLFVVPEIVTNINNEDEVNKLLISSTITQLFETQTINPDMFFYDVVEDSYAFKNEFFPLALSCVRNVLISQGFLIPMRKTQSTQFYIDSSYNSLISKQCKKQQTLLTLEALKRRLADNEIKGEQAEKFVLEFEQKRLNVPLCKKVKQISPIDVSAGYDIISFNSKCSLEYDRFIEVKATEGERFYWSKNEYEIAKLKGDNYYLYLVDLSKINCKDYAPTIIKNPAVSIMQSEEWLIETQSYCIRHAE